MQWTSKTWTKKHENQLLLFFFSRCRLSSWLLKLPDGQVDVVFLDLAEAFERLFHDTHYNGIRSNLALLLSNWIQPTCCSQRFCFFVVASIIRFASGLGQFFFGDDLPTNIASRIKLFADDCVLYRPINSIDDRLALNRAFNQLETTSVFLGNFKYY